MAAETQLLNAAGSGSAASHGLWAGTIKPFVIAHPVGVAVVGGILVGMSGYYLMKKFSQKKEEPTPA